MAWQSQPIYVTIPPPEPTPTESAATTVASIVLGAFGLVTVLLAVSIVLGGLVGWLLVRWHRQHPPEANHLPPVSPLVAGSDSSPTSPTR
ncbi:MAG TPA: hypothetical protein VMM93_10010 [Vicinamibacterales bacterium]|nr:hypothetical protein [Vicinamibacterales bacterium]